MLSMILHQIPQLCIPIRHMNKYEPESEGPKNQKIYVKSVRHQSQDGKEK